MIHLEQDPRAGAPLLGGLVDYRKITVGDRDWRIVWRVTEDRSGALLIEVAEVWALGYRKEGEVYAEVRRRIADAGDSPATRALSEVLALSATQSRGLEARPEPVEEDVLPPWLGQVLVKVVGLRPEQVEAMSVAEAEGIWAEYTAGPGSLP